jgi:hypothetical protein
LNSKCGINVDLAMLYHSAPLCTVKETLAAFWEGLKADAIIDWNPFFYQSWQYLHRIDSGFAAPEVARRFRLWVINTATTILSL